MKNNYRKTWTEINLSCTQHNVKEIKAPPKKSNVIAVVKADGYGHGAVKTARVAIYAGGRLL